jgi:hypothetical protein
MRESVGIPVFVYEFLDPLNEGGKVGFGDWRFCVFHVLIVQYFAPNV